MDNYYKREFDKTMKAKDKNCLPLTSKVLWNSYLKFVKDLHITKYSSLILRVDLNTELACEFTYFVNWERYVQRLVCDKINYPEYEEFIYEEGSEMVDIRGSYSSGQYDFSHQVPPGGVYLHFVLPSYSLDKIQFLSEGVLFKHLPELNCYSYLNFTGRLKCHITADIIAGQLNSEDDVNVSLGNSTNEQMYDKFMNYLMTEFAGNTFNDFITKYSDFIDSKSIGFEELLFYQYITGENMFQDFSDKSLIDIENSIKLIDQIVDNVFNETEFTENLTSSISVAMDGVEILNNYALELRKSFEQEYPTDIGERLKIDATEGALGTIVKTCIQKAANIVTQEKPKGQVSSFKNTLRLIPGARHGNRQINIALFYDESGREHVIRTLRNAPFDFLYYLSSRKLNYDNRGLKTTHSLTKYEIESVCPSYSQLNRYLTGWVNVIMDQDRPLKPRSEMKSEVNRHFNEWFRGGIIELSPNEEFSIKPDIELKLIPYKNTEFLKWLD